MVDALFASPRLAEVYDPFDPDRSDLGAYVAMVGEFDATRVVDLGCGTGTLGCLLAGRGISVVGIDPAAASLAVARRKPGADRVRRVHGDAKAMGGLELDPVTMTGSVAEVFVTDDDWHAPLRAIRAALGPGGRLVLETRVPARRAWEDWAPLRRGTGFTSAGVGEVGSWVDVG